MTASSKTTLLAAAFLGLTALVWYTGGPLMTGAAPLGIVSLQLAGSEADAAAILTSWDPAARRSAYVNIAVDFPYLLVYAGLLARLCGADTRRARMAWLAGLCDGVENLGLLYMLALGPEAAISAATTAFAVAKFTLIALVLLSLAWRWRRDGPHGANRA